MAINHGEIRLQSGTGFFSIDRGAFRCAAVGGLNSAIAHLILARGTGPDNVTTQWSVNATLNIGSSTTNVTVSNGIATITDPGTGLTSTQTSRADRCDDTSFIKRIFAGNGCFNERNGIDFIQMKLDR